MNDDAKVPRARSPCAAAEDANGAGRNLHDVQVHDVQPGEQLGIPRTGAGRVTDRSSPAEDSPGVQGGDVQA